MKHSLNHPSQRQLRVGEQIRHIVASTLQRGHFQSENLMDSGSIMVTEVRISPDLKKATAFVMTVGDKDLSETIQSLNEDHGIFQKEINKQTKLKFTPVIHFEADTSFDEAQKIESIINSLHYADDNS